MYTEKFSDELGPEMIIEVYDPKIRLNGILVIDNTTRGPAKGGIRITSTVDVEEVFRLARAMTYKNAIAEIPFGGGKLGIKADVKKLSKEQKKAMIESFSRALKPVCPSKYIAGPDINTTQEDMRWFAEVNGSLDSCTGKPEIMGGIPHELGSAGFGVAHAALVSTEHIGLEIKKANIAIEGFGNVGSFAARFLSEFGAKIIAISDSKGCIYNQDGLDIQKLAEIKKSTGSVINYKPGKVLASNEIFGLSTDIIIPAALPDAINENNVGKIKARIIVEGANIPIKDKIEEMLHKKGILVIPDIVANSGGVISSYVEYIHGTKEEMFRIVKEKITKNTKLILEKSEKEKISPRKAALSIARERLLNDKSKMIL